MSNMPSFRQTVKTVYLKAGIFYEKRYVHICVVAID